MSRQANAAKRSKVFRDKLKGPCTMGRTTRRNHKKYLPDLTRVSCENPECDSIGSWRFKDPARQSLWIFNDTWECTKCGHCIKVRPANDRELAEYSD